MLALLFAFIGYIQSLHEARPAETPGSLVRLLRSTNARHNRENDQRVPATGTSNQPGWQLNRIGIYPCQVNQISPRALLPD
jgi:hypothetical protein